MGGDGKAGKGACLDKAVGGDASAQLPMAVQTCIRVLACEVSILWVHISIAAGT